MDYIFILATVLTIFSIALYYRFIDKAINSNQGKKARWTIKSAFAISILYNCILLFALNDNLKIFSKIILIYFLTNIIYVVIYFIKVNKGMINAYFLNIKDSIGNKKTEDDAKKFKEIEEKASTCSILKGIVNDLVDEKDEKLPEKIQDIAVDTEVLEDDIEIIEAGVEDVPEYIPEDTFEEVEYELENNEKTSESVMNEENTDKYNEKEKERRTKNLEYAKEQDELEELLALIEKNS